MSWADSRLEDDVKLYTSYALDENGNQIVLGYAYGAPWVAQALMMDDLKFDSPEKAKEWWDRRYSGSK